MRAPDTHALYPTHATDGWLTAEDPADLGTAFGLDVSLTGPEVAPWPEPKACACDAGAPMDWLGRRGVGPAR